jgi:hypothetical protein
MKNIFILPTDQPSRLHLWTDENGMRLALCELEYSHTRNTQHIYITSDEVIKEGDWFIQLNFEKTNTQLIQCITEFQTKIANDKDGSFTKNKIILTTDPTLIADGVQAIDDDFLEWFIKNSSCEFVEVKSEWKLLGNDYEHNGYATLVYKIIIPQEEPKQESYICPHTKIQCDDECCVSAEDCHITSSLASGIVEPKQETLEEAAKECYPIHNALQHSTEYKSSIAEKRLAFLFGANYMAERMFSEEEVERLCMSAYNQATKDGSKAWLGTFEEWFEQFKKK